MTPTIKCLTLGTGESKLWCFSKIETNVMPNRRRTGTEMSALEKSHTLLLENYLQNKLRFSLFAFSMSEDGRTWLHTTVKLNWQ